MLTIYTNITSDALKKTFKSLLRPFDVTFELFEKDKETTKGVFLLDTPIDHGISFDGFSPEATVVCFETVPLKAPQIKNFYVLQKPFRVEHFILLMKKIMKHTLSHQDMTLDYDGRRLEDKKTGHTTTLTEKEAKLLLKLFQAKGHPVSKEDLLLTVWGYKSDLETQTLETHLYRLKKKLQSALGYEMVRVGRDGYFLEKELN